jgi:hypothetical protein
LTPLHDLGARIFMMWRSSSSPQLSPKRLMAGSILLILAGLLFEQLSDDLPNFSALAAPLQTSPVSCEKVIQSNATLSRSTLGKLLLISEGKSRQSIRDIVQQPYCRLPTIPVRSGAMAEREAYRLAFKPDTWLVVMYEGDSYAGFDFVMH